MTVGTQAAVLAGLDATMFIEFSPPPDTEWGTAIVIPRILKFFYYITITCAFCCNILVVSQTTILSLMGSSLALRGPDGSMITATDGLYDERKTIFRAFGFGLGATVGSLVLLVWISLSPEAAVVCMSITILTALKMYKDYYRLQKRFSFDENETVDFTDIFEGPAAIMAVPNWYKMNKRDVGKSHDENDYFYNRVHNEAENIAFKRQSTGKTIRPGPRAPLPTDHLDQNSQGKKLDSSSTHRRGSSSPSRQPTPQINVI